MIKSITFVKRAAGLTLAEFRSWYEDMYVGGQLGWSAELERHQRNYVVGSVRPAGWGPNFDVIDERWYSDAVKLEQARLLDPLEAPDADVAEIDQSLLRTFLVEEVESEILDSSYDFGTKLMLIMNRHDLYDMTRFRHRYEFGHALLARKMLSPSLLSYQRNYLTDPLTPGFEGEFDVVTSFEFAAHIPRQVSREELAYLIRDEEVFMDRSSQRIVQVDPLR